MYWAGVLTLDGGFIVVAAHFLCSFKSAAEFSLKLSLGGLLIRPFTKTTNGRTGIRQQLGNSRKFFGSGCGFR
jgi:hypothetical protein